MTGREHEEEDGVVVLAREGRADRESRAFRVRSNTEAAGMSRAADRAERMRLSEGSRMLPLHPALDVRTARGNRPEMVSGRRVEDRLARGSRRQRRVSRINPGRSLE